MLFFQMNLDFRGPVFKSSLFINFQNLGAYTDDDEGPEEDEDPSSSQVETQTLRKTRSTSK